MHKFNIELLFLGGRALKKKNNNVLLGIGCLAIGITLMLTIFISETTLKIITAFMLIGCGSLLIYK